MFTLCDTRTLHERNVLNLKIIYYEIVYPHEGTIIPLMYLKNIRVQCGLIV